MICIQCSKTFTGQRISAKYCSTLCRVTFNRNNKDLGDSFKPHCPTCNCDKEPKIESVITGGTDTPDNQEVQVLKPIIINSKEDILKALDSLQKTHPKYTEAVTLEKQRLAEEEDMVVVEKESYTYEEQPI